MGCQQDACPLSPVLLHILQHSLGVGDYGDRAQCRNHFVTSPEGDDGKRCAELVSMGYMRDNGVREITGGMNCYTVTVEGIDAVARQSPPRPPRLKLSRSKQRYRDYRESEVSGTFAEWLGIRR